MLRRQGARPGVGHASGNLDLSAAKTDDMLAHEYAREALKIGMQLETKLGTNPYKIGFIGSTDAHNSLSAIEEDNFFGKTPNTEPSLTRMHHPFSKTDQGVFEGYELSASSSRVGDVLRSLSKKKMYGSPNSNPSPELGADKENHTSWERYYQVSDCSSSLRNDWYSGI